MLNKNKLTLLLAAALGVSAAGRTAADPDRDHRRDRTRERAAAWVRLGDVGTHVHDEEDYISVQAGTRIDALQLRARDGVVAIDGVRVHYTDGSDQRIDVHRRLRPGEALSIDVPRSSAAVETLVLDYGNRGPFWRARETAHVQVMGLVDRDDWRGRFRERGDRYRADERAGDRDRDDRDRADRVRDDGDRDDRDRHDDRTRDRDGRPDRAPYPGIDDQRGDRYRDPARHSP